MVYSEEELKNVLMYPRPRLTVDIVVYNNGKFLVQERNLKEPEEYYKCWALPGGHINKGEHYANAAQRELKEEMGIEVPFMQLLNAYTETHFEGKEVDPRGWRCTIAVWTQFSGDVKIDNEEVSNYKWIDYNDLDNLAFNHKEILQDFNKMYGAYYACS